MYCNNVRDIAFLTTVMSLKYCMFIVVMSEDAQKKHSALMFCNIFNKLRKIYTGTSAIISKEIQPHSLNLYLQSI